MEKLKWIDSTGGPFVMLADNSHLFWSGIFKRSSYPEKRYEEVADVMDPAETDYGSACAIRDYLGVIDMPNDSALVFGDMPMSTTTLQTIDKKQIIVRWVYGENKTSVETILKNLDTTTLDNWRLALSFCLSDNHPYLFDAAADVNGACINPEAYLRLNIPGGKYDIWTSVYEPDSKTQLVIHRFDHVP